MSFGERLRIARERCGMTQLQVAERMKIDKSTYCGYETGKRQPDVQKIKMLSEILGVSGDDLFETGYSAPAGSGSKNQISDSELMFALWGNTENIDESDLEDVRRYAAFIKERKSKQ